MNADTAYTVSLSLGWDSAVRATKPSGSSPDRSGGRMRGFTRRAVNSLQSHPRCARLPQRLALCYNGGMKNAHVVYET